MKLLLLLILVLVGGFIWLQISTRPSSERGAAEGSAEIREYICDLEFDLAKDWSDLDPDCLELDEDTGAVTDSEIWLVLNISNLTFSIIGNKI